MEKTLFVMFDFPPKFGGAQIYNWDMIRALPKEKVVIIAPKYRGWKEFDATSEYKTYRLALGWMEKIKIPISPFIISWIARKERVKQIWFSKYSRIMFLTTFITQYLQNIPFGMTVFGEDLIYATMEFGINTPKIALYVRNNVIKKATQIIANSQFSGSNLPKGTNFSVVHPCIDINMDIDHMECDRPSLRIDTNSITYLSIGKLTRRKGFDLVLRALALGLPGVKNPRYIIIGSGEEEIYLKHLVEAHALDSVVEFYGEISLDEKIKILKHADIFLMPSRMEGFGIVFLEAALYKLCSIGSNVGGIPEVIEDGKTGILVENENIKELREAMAMLGQNNELREIMGLAAKKRCEDLFLWNQFSEKCRTIFQA